MMRARWVGMVLISGCTGVFSPSTGAVTMTVDEFTGTRRVKLDRSAVHFENRLNGVMMTAFGLVGGSTAVLQLHSQSDTWTYLRCNHVHLLGDGEPISTIGTEHDGHVHGGVSETISVTLRLDALEQLASAAVARLRICTDTATLTSDQQAALRRVLHGVRHGELAGHVPRGNETPVDDGVPSLPMPANMRECTAGTTVEVVFDAAGSATEVRPWPGATADQRSCLARALVDFQGPQGSEGALVRLRP